MAKKKTKVALAAVSELIGYELEFAFEAAQHIRAEASEEQVACELQQLEVDTVGWALQRIEMFFPTLSKNSVKRLVELAVAKRAAPELMLRHLWRDEYVSSYRHPLEIAHKIVGDGRLDTLLQQGHDGLHWLVWEGVPVEKICESSASTELKAFWMVSRFVESQAQGLRDGF